MFHYKKLYLTWEVSQAIINVLFSIFRRGVSFTDFHQNIQVVYSNYYLHWFGQSRDNRSLNYFPNNMGLFGGVGGEKSPKYNLFLAYCFIIFLLKYFIGALYNTYVAQFELLLFSMLTWWWYLRLGMGIGVSKNGHRL